MSTFLQVLRLAFWINPLHRVLTCIGGTVIIADNIHSFTVGSRAFVLPSSFLGVAISCAASLLVGGLYWRIASAPRIVRLAPRGRTRLLGSILGLVLLIALLWMAQYWLFWLSWMAPDMYPAVATQLLNIADAALFPSLVIVGLFMASRSPLAALLVLIAVILPGMTEKLFDFNLRRLAGNATGLYGLALIWMPFAIWYLNVRRVSFPRWLASGAQDVLATSMISSTIPASQREAVERLLLGGTTVLRFGLQWFVILGLLLALEWVLAQVGDEIDPELVSRAMYISLCIGPIVTSIVSFAAIRRSRALWLLSGPSRGEFYISVERILLRMNVVMLLAVAIWLAVVWSALSWKPGPFMEQLNVLQVFWLEAFLVIGILASYSQLAQLPKWPIAILGACLLASVWQAYSGIESDGTTSSALTGIYAAVLLPVAGTATIALRWLAQRRWCDGDFPRSVTSAASGT